MRDHGQEKVQLTRFGKPVDTNARLKTPRRHRPGHMTQDLHPKDPLSSLFASRTPPEVPPTSEATARVTNPALPWTAATVGLALFINLDATRLSPTLVTGCGKLADASK